jgi:uncharacterized protein (UPF0332 family)
MLDDKKIEEAKNYAFKSINQGEIFQTKEILHVNFFLNNSKNSLDCANALFEISLNEKIRSLMGFEKFDGYLWVINASYYSMFYNVRALLESIGVKIKGEESIHFNVFNSLIYYFYSNGRLDRKFIEYFEDAGEEAAKILGKEKARKVVTDYSSEKEKRGRFTYQVGEIAMRGKAETSLNRAKLFNEEIRKLITT